MVYLFFLQGVIIMKSNIRWRQKDITLLKKEVKNFNTRLAYYNKKYSNQQEYLPSKISYKDIKHSITTRTDFNRTIKNLKSFNSKTSKPIIYEGKKTTKYAVDTLKRSVKNINRIRAKKRQEADVSTEKGTMGTIEANNLKPRKVNSNTIPQADWDKFIRSLFSQEKASLYTRTLTRASYTSATETIWAEMGICSPFSPSGYPCPSYFSW